MFDLTPASHPHDAAASPPFAPHSAPDSELGSSPAAAPRPTQLPTESQACYAGPERRTARPVAMPWLAATLDEIDYGMLLLTDLGHAIHVNHAARNELDAAHPLQLFGGELRARRPQDAAPLLAALEGAARRGLRKLLTLGDGTQRVSASVVPIAGAVQDGGATVLVMLGKRQVCGELAVQGFARVHGLTGAETRVLMALCNGVPPGKAAEQLGVAISTVRTQIGNIRIKTGAQSIRDLVRQVAVLPPMMGVLRGGTAGRFLPMVDDAALSAG